MSDAPLLRLCARCHVEKAIGEFPVKNAARGTYRSYCRPCCREYGKEHYRNNVATYVRRSKARAAIDRPRNREFVAEYLATHPCVDCGESDPVVLEFDHRDRSEKRDDVGRLIHTSTVNIVRAEIAKCDVRCGNCHRRKTARDFGWAKFAGSVE